MADPIDRQAAIDALIEWYGCEPTDIGAFENIIEKLPSAQPERKTGRWEKVYGEHIRIGHRPWTVCCSECGMIGGGTRYCPNCGADMRGGVDGADGNG